MSPQFVFISFDSCWVSCSAVIGQGRHLMIYSCGRVFYILFSHHHVSDLHVGLPPTRQHVSCCHEAQVIEKRKTSSFPSLSGAYLLACLFYISIKPLTACDRRVLHNYWFQVWRINAECCPWLICGLSFPLHILIRQSVAENQGLGAESGLSMSSNPIAKEDKKLERV